MYRRSHKDILDPQMLIAEDSVLDQR